MWCTLSAYFSPQTRRATSIEVKNCKIYINISSKRSRITNTSNDSCGIKCAKIALLHMNQRMNLRVLWPSCPSITGRKRRFEGIYDRGESGKPGDDAYLVANIGISPTTGFYQISLALFCLN